MIRARLIVKGNVQGVGYRTLVKLFAGRFGVNGLVRNLEDGSVEVFVDGSEVSVRKFLKAIEVKGKPEDPLSLHVDEIEVHLEGTHGYRDAWKEYRGFELDYGVEDLRPGERETLESLEWSKLHFAGMSRVFREELGGVKGEIVGVKAEVGGVRKEILEVKEGIYGVKEELAGVRSEIGNMHRDLKEDTAGIKEAIVDMHRDLKEDTAGIKEAIVGMHRDLKEDTGVIKEEIRDMHKGLRDEIVGVRGEIRDMRVDMNKSFEEMAKRYDAISAELIRTREDLTRAVSALLKLIEEFIHERPRAERMQPRE